MTEAQTFAKTSPQGQPTPGPGEMRLQAPPRFVLVRETVDSRLQPGAFLRWGRGRPRGFWARGRGWLAHVGELESLVVHSGAGSRNRFLAIQDRARSFARPENGLGWRGAGQEPAVRFYGGFSFRDDHVPRDFWAAFPSARFVLPDLELEHDGETVRLTTQALAGPGDDVATVRGQLRARLDYTLKGVARAARNGDHRALRPAARLRSGRRNWQRAVEEILSAIQDGRMEKAVLARILDVSTTGALDPVEVLEYLRRENTDAHVFLFEPVAGSPIVGATPEALATVRGDRFSATAVAGSVSRGGTDEEQRALAHQLLDSAKDRVEHAFTVKDMVARLEPLSRTVEVQAEPHVLTLAPHPAPGDPHQGDPAARGIGTGTGGGAPPDARRLWRGPRRGPRPALQERALRARMVRGPGGVVRHPRRRGLRAGAAHCGGAFHHLATVRRGGDRARLRSRCGVGRDRDQVRAGAARAGRGRGPRRSLSVDRR